jgi:membrane-bound ClpP family serine protease
MITEWITVLSLLIFGLILIVVEVIFIPGTTLVGILGLLSSMYGIYLGYDYFNATTGSVILAGDFVAIGVAFYLGLRSGFWERLSLKQVISSRVNDDEEPLIIGDIGKTVSSLKPFGKTSFNGQIREVQALDAYIEAGEQVKIISITGKKIYVSPLRARHEMI